jgi:hypothetical protein
MFASNSGPSLTVKPLPGPSNAHAVGKTEFPPVLGTIIAPWAHPNSLTNRQNPSGPQGCILAAALGEPTVGAL